ncbi:hypothetical protein B6S12_08565 [Helicobacter valdiviensis]|uniref:WG repeat-containing protein n=1 Tax=Helicobacter valdiviensis TaxID=1458358 RepID=A0A2W6MSL6_9HELI|nr:WG repeat-containing protein [Helicobacter valdiviensis]PZT47555.1 hypothetical protein B6S12_08565 [Helicobacter valdiviensis]
MKNTKKELIFTDILAGVKYFTFEDKGKFGILREDNKVVLKPVFDVIEDFSINYFEFNNDEQEHLFVNKHKNLKNLYYEGKSYNFGLLFRLNSKFGIVDFKGNVIIKPIYTYIHSFNNDGLAFVRKDKKCGYINKKGEVIVKIEYDQIYTTELKAKNYIFIKNEKYGLMDKKFNILLEDCEWIQSFSDKDSYCLFSENGKYGVLNRNGEIVVNPVYEKLFMNESNFFYKEGDNFKKITLKKMIANNKKQYKISHNEFASFLKTPAPTLYNWGNNDKDYKKNLYNFLRSFKKQELEYFLKSENGLSDYKISKITKVPAKTLSNWAKSDSYLNVIYRILKGIDLKALNIFYK